MDAPPLAEKVLFWQEQDQINQALIPRVIRTHELLIELAKKEGLTSAALANFESRVQSEIKALRDQNAQLKAILESQVKSELGALRDQNAQLKTALESRVTGVEERLPRELSDLSGKLTAENHLFRALSFFAFLGSLAASFLAVWALRS